MQFWPIGQFLYVRNIRTSQSFPSPLPIVSSHRSNKDQEDRKKLDMLRSSKSCLISLKVSTKFDWWEYSLKNQTHRVCAKCLRKTKVFHLHSQSKILWIASLDLMVKLVCLVRLSKIAWKSLSVHWMHSIPNCRYLRQKDGNLYQAQYRLDWLLRKMLSTAFALEWCCINLFRLQKQRPAQLISLER